MRLGITAFLTDRDMAPGALAREVALWQELGTLAAQTVGLNLDKRAALTVAIGKIHGL